MAESSYDAHYVTLIDVTIEVTMDDGRREIEMVAAVPHRRHRDGDARSRGRGRGRELEAELAREMDVPLATIAVELDSRNATVRTRRGRDRQPDRRRDARQDRRRVAAIMNGGGIRGGKVYRAGSTITRRDVLAELPFGNRVVTIEITRPRPARRDWKTASRGCRDAAGRFPQVSGMTIEFDPRRPPGQRMSVDQGRRRAARSETGSTGSRPTISWRAAATATTSFGKAKPLLPADDSPLLANEVMDYVRKLGTVRSRRRRPHRSLK